MNLFLTRSPINVAVTNSGRIIHDGNSGMPFSSVFKILEEFFLNDSSRVIVLKRVTSNPWNSDTSNLESLFEEGLRVNPESPFLHYRYSIFLKNLGKEKLSEEECEKVDFWFKKNQENTGYLFMDYKEMTEKHVNECKGRG